MKHRVIFISALLAVSILTSCATPSPSSTKSPSISDSAIQPGDAIGEMTLSIARDETGEPSIFNYCSPAITDTDPAIITRTCNIPQMPYTFIGYGDFAASQKELESIWENEIWELYFDGNPVHLAAFGLFDVDWEGYRLRQWKIAVENVTPGEHKLRYLIGSVDNAHELRDVTWIFTVGNNSSSETPTSGEIISYPVFSPTVAKGQNPYTSEKAHLNFLLYVPDDYGKDTQKKWPLILFLHGAGNQGNNLEHLKLGGLPKRLESISDFPAIVVSPQGSGQYEFWSKEEMINSLFTLMDEIQASYSIDPKRIYLTGASVGGNGTWEIGLRYPERFAALVPVMGYYGYPFQTPANICDLKNVPVWAFHGAKDETVPLEAEEDLVNALKACGGKAQITIFPNSGHDIANEVYENPDLYTWMFSQTLK